MPTYVCGLFRTFSAALTLALGFAVSQTGAQTLNEYTLPVPADVPTDATLCQANIVIAGTGIYAATMSHNSTDPLPDGGALGTILDEFEYRTWVASRGGARTLVIQTNARNLFSVEANFCRAPADADTAAMDVFPVNAPLVGGSPREEDQRGQYAGLADLKVELCGYDDPFPLVEQIQSKMDRVISSDPDTHIVFKTYDTSADGATAYLEYQLAGHRTSLQIFADQAVEAFADLGEFTDVPGDRKLTFSNCDKQGFWITVAEGDRILWEEEWTGPRFIATRQKTNNIFFTYAAGIQNVFFNIAGAVQTGQYPIGAPPPPDSDVDPETMTYGMLHYRGQMPTPIMVTSTQGTYWLTSLHAALGISGHFKFIAQEEGSPRTVWGGFRNLKLHEQ